MRIGLVRAGIGFGGSAASGAGGAVMTKGADVTRSRRAIADGRDRRRRELELPDATVA
jgi:hypothetical protein